MANDKDYGIILEAKLDIQSSIKNINKQISTQLKPESLKTIKLRVELDEKSINKEIEKITSRLKNMKISTLSPTGNGGSANTTNTNNALEEKQLKNQIKFQQKAQKDLEKSHSDSLKRRFDIDQNRQRQEIKNLQNAEQQEVKIRQSAEQQKLKIQQTANRTRLAEANKSNKQMSQSQRNIENSSTGLLQIGTNFQSIIDKSVMFAASFGVFQLFINNLKEGITFVNQLNTSLTNIQMVTMNTSKEMAVMSNQFNDMAIELKASTKDIADASVEYFRQGKSQVEVMELVKATTIGASISSLGLSQTTEYLTSTMNGMGISAGNVMDIVDKFSNVGNLSASSFEELAAGMTKVSANASTVGVSLDALIGYMATIQEATRENPETIGTSLNSIFSRYTSITKEGINDEDSTGINDVATALQSIGISSMDAQGQFRDFEDVLNDVGTKWESLDTIQKNYIATTMAGSRQKNRLLTLFNNFDRALELEGASMSSGGRAMEQYNIYMESTQAKMAEFKANMQKLWMGMFKSDAINTVIKGMTIFVQILQKVDNVIGLIPLGITLVIGRIIMMSATMKGASAIFGQTLISTGSLGNAFNAFKGSLTGYNSILGDIKMGMVAYKMESAGAVGASAKFSAGVSGVTTVLQGTKLALIGATITTIALQAAMTMGLSIAISAVISGFSKLMGSAKKAKEEKELYIESIKKEREENIKNIASMQQLMKEYNNLSLDNTLDSRQKMNDITTKLVELLPDVISYYDAEGNAILKSTEEINKMIQAQRVLNSEKSKIANNGAFDKARDTIGDISGEYKDAEKYKKRIETRTKSISELKEKLASQEQDMAKVENGSLIGKVFTTSSNQGIKDTKMYLKTDTDKLHEYEDELLKSKTKIEEINAQIIDAFKMIPSEFAEFDNSNPVEVKFFNDFSKDFVQTHEITSDNLDDTRKEYTKFVDDILKLNKDGKINITKLSNKDDIENAISIFKQYGYSTKVLEEQLKAVEPNIDEQIKKLQTDLATSLASGLDVTEIQIKLETLGEIKTTNKMIEDFEKAGKNTDILKNKLQVLYETLNNLTMEKIAQRLETNNEKTKDGISELSNLADVFKTLSEGGELSVSVIADLITKYPSVAKHIAETNDLQLKRGDIIRAVWEDEKKINQARIQASIAEANAMLRMLETTAASGRKIQQDVASGKYSNNPAVESQIISNLANNSKYKDAEANRQKILDDIATYNAQLKFFSSDATMSLFDSDNTKTNDFNELDKYFDYNFRLQKIKNEITNLNGQQDVSEGKEKIALIEKEIALIQKQKIELNNLNKAQRARRDELIKDLKGDGFKFSGYGDSATISNPNNIKYKDKDTKALFDEFVDLQQKAIPDITQQWWGATKAIYENQDAIKGVSEEMQKALQKIKDEKIKTVEDAEKQITDILKEEQKARQKVLDDELKDYEGFINAKLDLLENEDKVESFNKDKNAKLKEVNDIQSQLTDISMDDSKEAMQKRAELESQLFEKKQALEDTINKYGRDREKDALKQQIEDKKTEVQNKKDALELEYSDEKMQMKAKQLLMYSTLAEIKTMFSQYIVDFQDDLAKMGIGVSDTLIQSFTKAKEAISGLSKLTGVSISPGSVSTTDTSGYINSAILKQQATELSLSEYQKQREDLRKKYESSLQGFSQGGVVDSTGAAMLHGSKVNPEIVFNANDASKLYSIVRTLPTAVSRSNVSIPTIQNNVEVKIETLVKVDGNVDKDMMPRIQKASEGAIDKLVSVLNSRGTIRR